METPAESQRMRTTINPINVPAQFEASELDSLRRLVDEFVAFEESDADLQRLHHLIVANVHAICANVLRCEEAGFRRDAIVEVLAPVRAIHARSPFVHRLQAWPRGYPGDFETIEHLWSGRNRADEGTIASLCERYSLDLPIAQQHRNKVHQQASRILRTLLQRPGASIFSVACGSCPDLRMIADHIDNLGGDIWLNDGDTDALAFSVRNLGGVGDRVHIRPGNALRVVRRTAQSDLKFDLVLAGGLFDYLSDKQATYLIENAYAMLQPGGVFFFTNIARGNPYRSLIEYLGDWFLIERSEEDVMRFCADAGVPADRVVITRDSTGLALLIEVTK